jgi:hypothetical protein
MLNSLDACGLQIGLDANDANPTGSASASIAHVIGVARARGQAAQVPGLPADQEFAIVPGSAPTPACLREFQSDSGETLPYAAALARQTVGRDGRLGGDIVYVREMGPSDTLLRSRFGDRTWYRYRLPRSLLDTALAFVPW